MNQTRKLWIEKKKYRGQTFGALRKPEKTISFIISLGICGFSQSLKSTDPISKFLYTHFSVNPSPIGFVTHLKSK
jgi:hypothetical protein